MSTLYKHLDTSADLYNIGGILGGAMAVALIAFGIAYAARGRRKVRDWNAVAKWFFWTALILPALSYSANAGRK